MDIATYNQTELLAQARLSSWRFQQIFSPLAFEQVGFPARIAHIGQIRGLLSGMHSPSRIPGVLSELDGLREEDLGQIARAVAIYMKWYRSVFSDETVPIPLGDLMAYYLAYTKLRGIAGRSRVLEVGPGYGLMSLFVSSDPAIETYDMIEITQSLYVIQSSIGRHCFDESFRAAALPADNPAQVGRLGGARSSVHSHLPFSLKMGRKFRSTLYPWWGLDESLQKQYDVIMSHSNLVEMSPGARRYYFENWKRMLSDNGYVFVQDFGHTVHSKNIEVLQGLEDNGFRALVKFSGAHRGKRFCMVNLLLVTERHPAYGQAKSLLEQWVFQTENEAVRQIYGLDRPAGRQMSPTDILKHAVAKIGVG